MRIAAYVLLAWLALSIPVCVFLAVLLAGAKLRQPDRGDGVDHTSSDTDPASDH
jgi:hypothetical protein